MDPDLIIAGFLTREYIIPPVGNPMLDVPGGDLLYAAAGTSLWRAHPEKCVTGLLGRVGEDYSHDWLRSFEQRGLDVRGIHILPGQLDLRSFRAYLDPFTVQRNNPMAHFARLGLPYPKSLLGYQPPAEELYKRKKSNPAAPHPGDIPAAYLEARTAHLCPLDYLTTSRFLTAFQKMGVTTRTLDPSADYMTPTALDDVRTLLQGLTAFLPSKEDLRALFWSLSDDLWEMVEALASFGCEFIVVKCGRRGQMLYDCLAKKRWEIPSYPIRLADPTGAGDSFCGGFLAGYHNTYDPLRAVLFGNISASLTIEGSGVFHALEALPGLAQARLESLAGLVRLV